jgi:hypothetical protein
MKKYKNYLIIISVLIIGIIIGMVGQNFVINSILKNKDKIESNVIMTYHHMYFNPNNKLVYDIYDSDEDIPRKKNGQSYYDLSKFNIRYYNIPNNSNLWYIEYVSIIDFKSDIVIDIDKQLMTLDSRSIKLKYKPIIEYGGLFLQIDDIFNIKNLIINT